jgi:hypothetical protein
LRPMGVTTPVPVTTTRRAPFAFAISYLPVVSGAKGAATF